MIRKGMDVETLDTPCLLVDLDRMETNIRAWQARISATGVHLRPHVKTHKVPQIAQLQLKAGATGITVAKLAEAEVFAQAGCNDIFIAYPLIGPQKWTRAAKLATACTLIVGVDSQVGAEGLSRAAAQQGCTLLVRVEVDTGLNRSGVSFDGVAALCESVKNLPGLELDGLFTFRSIFFAGAKGRTAAELGCEEGQCMVDLTQRLQRSGIEIRQLSVGSTPTAQHAATVEGISEVRPGTYVFGDIMMAHAGVMAYDDIALSILCTVVSRPAPNRATVDGGSKTFSGDIYPSLLGLKGYARSVNGDAYVTSLSEEHGVVHLNQQDSGNIGDKMAFYPLHVCTTVNLSDELVGLRKGRVEKIWPILARGKRT